MFKDVPLMLIEDDAGLREVVDLLSREPVIGVDTESDSFHHYKEQVCLIQVSIPGVDIIIDPLKVPDLSSLAPTLANPHQVKVLHGADYDVVCLKRDFGFQLRGLFDTLVAARFLDEPRVGLGDLIEAVFGVSLEKKYQRHDWARRPLGPEHLEYARADTHWLLALREVLLHRLGRAQWLEAAQEECALVEQREWTGKNQDPADFLRVKGSGLLSDQGKRVLRALYQYRDSVAQRMNRPVFKVIPDRVLLEAARRLPASREALAPIMRPRSAMARQHGDAILRAVRRGLQDDTPLPARKKPAHPKRRGGRNVQLVTEQLRQWRNQRLEAGEPGPRLLSNGLIREIARACPRTTAELLEVPEIRRWQVDRYGDEFLALIEDALG